jgi:cytochrome bd-type quinol oxidase subunit 1
VGVLMAAGIVVGITLGFVVGRRWAEYFRAAVDARGIMNNRKNYRGRSDLAFVLGGLLILGILIFYANSATY